MGSRSDAPTFIYRIVSARYPPFDGTGAFRWGSRWVSPGRWVVHAAQTYSLAVLENLVHWRTSTLPPTLVCVRVEIPKDVTQECLEMNDLPADLSNQPAWRALGDSWYDRGESLLMWVPSVVSPHESNVLVNHRHAAFSRLLIGDPISAPIDSRLFESTE